MTKHTQKLSFEDIGFIAYFAATTLKEMADCAEKTKDAGNATWARSIRAQIVELWAPFADAKSSVGEVAKTDSMLPQSRITGFEEAAVAKVIPLLTVLRNNLPDYCSRMQAIQKTCPADMGALFNSASRGLGSNGANGGLAGNINGMLEAEKCSGARPRSTRASNHGANYICDFLHLCPISDSAGSGGVTVTVAEAHARVATMGSR